MKKMIIEINVPDDFNHVDVVRMYKPLLDLVHTQYDAAWNERMDCKFIEEHD